MGLESHELELEEGLDPGEKLRQMNEGMDLMVARPRFYVSRRCAPAQGYRVCVPIPKPEPGPLLHPTEPGAAARGPLWQLPVEQQ